VLVLEGLALLCLMVFLSFTIRHLLFIFKSISEDAAGDELNEGFTPSVSVLIPAHNEKNVIGKTLEAMLNQDYPDDKLEIIVIDDASTDGTGAICDRFSRDNDQMKVVHRLHGGNGKPDALNEGIKVATGEVILVFDADYVPCTPMLIRRLVRHFKDPKIGAVQGNVLVWNKKENLITRLVYLERIGGFEIEFRGKGLFSIPVQFGGTVGGFRRTVLEEIGYWNTEGLSSLTEDTEATIRTILSGYGIKYDVTAYCYEEAVDSLKKYYHQRRRWATGHQACFFKYVIDVLRAGMPLSTKIDTLFVLNYYFIPVLVLVAIFLTAVDYFWIPVKLIHNPIWWWGILLWLAGGFGNLAPLISVQTGLWLKKDLRSTIYVTALPFINILNILIALAALFTNLTHTDLQWAKTKKEGYSPEFQYET